jgi:Protein of unknown function (DUF2530)
MTPDSPLGPDPVRSPPQLPAQLADPQPVIVVGALIWLAATILAFTVPAVENWRPVTLAGLGAGALGTAIFVWQRSAARRGARGAQTGLNGT